MCTWAALFLVIAIVAGVLGVSMQIACILFVAGLVLAVVFCVLGRRPRIWTRGRVPSPAETSDGECGPRKRREGRSAPGCCP